MALRPSSVPPRVHLPAPPKSSLPKVPDPESDRARAASPTVARLLATSVTDPSFESAAASALVAELLDFAAACRLDYASALVAESVPASPPSVGGECALGTDVLEDRQEDFERLAAAVPRFASLLLAPEGDPDDPGIPTPRSNADAITEGTALPVQYVGHGARAWRTGSSCPHCCEAEIYAGAMAVQVLRWLTYLLTDLGEQPCLPPVLYVDNKAMIALCQEHRLEHKTKHIALRYFLGRELQQCGQLHLAYVAIRANTVDIFTCERGGREGDPRGPLLFAAGIHPALRETTAAHPNVLCLVYADDVTFLGEQENTVVAFTFFTNKLAHMGLAHNPEKCAAWSSPAVVTTQLPLGVPFSKDGVRLLGSYLGPANGAANFLAGQLKEMAKPLPLLERAGPQVASLLLTRCISRRVAYLTRTTPLNLLYRNTWSQWGRDLLATLLTSCGMQVPSCSTEHSRVWAQASLPSSLGGIGITDLLVEGVHGFVASFT
ncbi:unnamed protein product [Closterium sp. NIES-54]